MPAKDAFHEAVKRALMKEGWQIQADPLHLKWGKRDFFVDLAADRFILADKGNRRIAVEIKGFGGNSPMAALEQTLGQFLIYRSILKRKDPTRQLYLAISRVVFRSVFSRDVGLLVVQDYDISLLIFDHRKEEIIEWKP